MPKPKRLSGGDVVKILQKFGFVVESQNGSHIKIIRLTSSGKQMLLISNHRELKTGAVIGIYKQALAYIPETTLRSHFYTD